MDLGEACDGEPEDGELDGSLGPALDGLADEKPVLTEGFTEEPADGDGDWVGGGVVMGLPAFIVAVPTCTGKGLTVSCVICVIVVPSAPSMAATAEHSAKEPATSQFSKREIPAEGSM